jgi:hypothetical protein
VSMIPRHKSFLTLGGAALLALRKQGGIRERSAVSFPGRTHFFTGQDYLEQLTYCRAALRPALNVIKAAYCPRESIRR